MNDDIRQQAIRLYDRFTHEGLERRDFMAQMVRLTGSAAAANLLVGSIAASAQAKPLSDPADKRLRTATMKLSLPGGLPAYTTYVAEPVRGARGTVMVIHENRGLNDHIRDVARRLALAGFHVVAPDFLTPSGGTPANEDQARDLIGKLDMASATRDAVAIVTQLQKRPGGNGKVGAVGFCWGGGFVDRLAVNAGQHLAAGVAYYGPAPAPAEAARVEAPLLLHYAGLDERVDATGKPWVAALQAAHKPVESYTYPGVNHAFNNDTSADRYNKPAADLAWGRTLAFLKRHLA
ncbi:dienelactone hydrolase family protein [Sphingomonas ginkgonis]|uniref:Dienelactone hydrolase family protein n=1 Tax=Sphingomonas ginkgonis TaxID=2315330 RepID=A0A3R9X9E4_9SPHN|nr:dienelactone hydrolase family protein [Sphingomonas ginkgonis]RST31841.1 dienelactone hydrolase family protein [Sphingomonas ginkgonis]